LGVGELADGSVEEVSSEGGDVDNGWVVGLLEQGDELDGELGYQWFEVDLEYGETNKVRTSNVDSGHVGKVDTEGQLLHS
jgi:hypothetical protein